MAEMLLTLEKLEEKKKEKIEESKGREKNVIAGLTCNFSCARMHFSFLLFFFFAGVISCQAAKTNEAFNLGELTQRSEEGGRESLTSYRSLKVARKERSYRERSLE